MKILILTPRYYPEQFKITQIAQYLAKDNEVDVICNIPDYHLGKYYKGYSLFKNRKQVINNVNVYRLPTIPRGKTLIGLFFSYLSLYISGLFKANFIKKKYDIVINYQLSPVYIATIGNKIAKKQKIPSITYILDYWPDSLSAGSSLKSNNFIYRIVAKQSRKIYLNSSYIFTTSNGFKKPLIDLGFNQNKIYFYPNFGEEIFENKIINKNYCVETKNIENKLKILFAGNIGKVQNLDLLVSIAYEAKKDNNTSFVFLIVGEGSYKNSLINIIKNKNVADYFEFYGEQPIYNMPNFYQLADAFYFSLLNESIVGLTIPGKLSSYLCYNKPIIASIKGECLDILNSYGGGIIINQENGYLKITNLIRNYSSILKNIDCNYYLNNFSKKTILSNIEYKIEEIINNDRK